MARLRREDEPPPALAADSPPRAGASAPALGENHAIYTLDGTPTSLDARIRERRKERDDLRVRETRLAKSLQLLADASSIIPELNTLAASRKWAERELDELVFQQQHAAAMAERLRGLDARLVQEWERLDVLPYDERRAKLREFNVAVTLWKRDHEPRFAIDRAFDSSAWDVIDEEEAP